MASPPKNRKWILATAMVLGTLLFSIACAELLLKVFLPYPRAATIGHLSAPNASLYGWGFHPGELAVSEEPDTHERFEFHLNNHGWRDNDRTFENPSGAYRILVLGDSVTYAGTVPLEQAYPRRLEARLRAQGYNIEVISMGYGGWGTDQELEALHLEGLKYHPHLILLQFCNNDLTDNLCGRDEKKLNKPFYYTLDGGGGLQRNVNPNFEDVRASGLFSRNTLKEIAVWSEIGKRIYSLQDKSKDERHLGPTTHYKVTPGSIDRACGAFHLDPQHALLRDLRALSGHPVQRAQLEGLIKSQGLESHEEDLLRLFEVHWFTPLGTEDSYRPAPLDPEWLGWRLYCKLVERIKTVADQAGVALALFSETDLGAYEWRRYWYQIAPEEVYRENFLGPSQALQGLAMRLGTGFAPQKRKYVRARNDPHANALGNQAMADDLYDYLMSSYGSEFQKFGLRKAEPPPSK